MNPSRPALLVTVLIALLAACAPQATEDPAVADSARVREVERVAEIAYHRMEIGRLQTGAYTTNVLIDIELPQGVRWTVLEFGDDHYVLRFTADDVPDAAWMVDPGGVRAG